MFSTAMRRKPSATSCGLRPSPISSARAANFSAHDVGVERLVGIRSEDGGEMVGVQLAQHDVAIGDGQRPALAVTGGTRDRRRRFRADLEAAFANDRTDPPPAATVWICIIGHASARPRPRSRSCAHRFRRSGRHRSRCRPCRSRSACRSPASSPVRTMPTTPPAGPERIASRPWNSCRVGQPTVRLHEIEPLAAAAVEDRARRPPDRRSGAGSARGRRRPPRCRRARRA
jgi:hypothetical protein